jgi:hypothetical protein
VTTGLNRLRSYQLPVARAVIASVLQQRGLTFVCRMSRQAGKNEASAQLEAALLALAMADATPDVAPTIVKAAPTLNPQTQRSARRLRDTLRRARLPFRTEAGTIVHAGPASVSFASGEPNANVVGDTAGLLLEIDEAQDFDIDTYDKKFAPMRAAFNATAILWGTPWSDVDLLERERQAALERTRRDDVQRCFDADWHTVADTVPAYRAFVEAERTRLGPTNPLFTTQYELQVLAGAGHLFTPDLIAQLRGDHQRRTTPPPTARIVAGLDLAGGATDHAETHDRTVLTLGAVTPPSPADPIQQNHAAVLHHITWQGTPHDVLLPQLRDLLANVWRVQSVAVDATGIGETTARVLANALGEQRVIPVKFSRAKKSDLGFELITTTATGRLKLYEPDASAEATTMWHEVHRCRRTLLPGNLIDWRVPEDEGHDDYITSLALLAHAANHTQARIARGRTP